MRDSYRFLYPLLPPFLSAKSSFNHCSFVLFSICEFCHLALLWKFSFSWVTVGGDKKLNGLKKKFCKWPYHCNMLKEYKCLQRPYPFQYFRYLSLYPVTQDISATSRQGTPKMQAVWQKQSVTDHLLYSEL